MSKLLKEDILKALQTVTDQDAGKDVVNAGMVSSIVIRGNSVGFAIEVDMDKSSNKEELRKKCEEVVKGLNGVDRVTAVLTSNKNEEANSSPSKPIKRKISNITGVKNVIVVASGKGGVGKSTVAVNLAYDLTKKGFKTAIVDADVYGPSIPRMLGVSGKPEHDENNKIIPKKKRKIESVSMGYFLEEDKAAIWRGPMVIKALHQLFFNTAWKDIDYLIVDTPPGTGDVQISLAKNFPITGVVFVSTPQEVSIQDVRKATEMFRAVNVPIIGVVENMSFYEEPSSGKKSYLFGKGGVKKFAKKEKLNFLGEVPLDASIGENLDKGKYQENDYFADIGKGIIKIANGINNFIKNVE